MVGELASNLFAKARKKRKQQTQHSQLGQGFKAKEGLARLVRCCNQGLGFYATNLYIHKYKW